MSPDRGTGALPVPPKAPTPDTPDQLISLAGVYAARYASDKTLLWQLPALSLTAQAFLLTIALSHSNGVSARVTAAALSAVTSAASYALMENQTVATMLLVLVIVAVAADPKAPVGVAAVAIGFSLAAVVFACGPLTRASVNPEDPAGLSGRDLLAAPRAG